MIDIKSIAKAATIAAIGGDKNHGWGVNDSMEVIDTLIAECSDEIAKEKGPSEALSAAIK